MYSSYSYYQTLMQKQLLTFPCNKVWIYDIETVECECYCVTWNKGFRREHSFSTFSFPFCWIEAKYEEIQDTVEPPHVGILAP